MLLCHRSHALNRAHLRPSIVAALQEPFVIAQATPPHPIDIAAKFPRCRRRRLGLPLGPEQLPVLVAHGARRLLRAEINDHMQSLIAKPHALKSE
jgi:hypothetical protein